LPTSNPHCSRTKTGRARPNHVLPGTAASLPTAVVLIDLLVAAPLATRFAVRPPIFVGDGYLVFTCLYALVPHIRNLEPSLRKEKAS
jgi:hypothetical protein